MLYIMQVIKLLGLDVKKPMVLEMNNKGAVDSANNWSDTECTRYVDV